MIRRAPLSRRRRLALLTVAALLLALGAYSAVGNESEKRHEGAGAISARVAQRFFARAFTKRERAPTGAELSGRVLTLAGVPIQRARVCAACASCLLTHSDVARCMVSDDNGFFSIEVENTVFGTGTTFFDLVHLCAFGFAQPLFIGSIIDDI